MKKEWKVYIKGVPNRGDEIIKILTNLGANNDYNYDGYASNYFIYFINHEGNISSASINSEPAKIIMDNYREIKLPEWKDGDILIKNDGTCYKIFLRYDLSHIANFYAYSVSVSIKDEKIMSGKGTVWVCDRKDYRLATPSEIERFRELLHKYGKDWDIKKRLLVNWKCKPKYGDMYWVINTDGYVKAYIWNEDSIDNKLFDLGNYFCTRKEAETMAEKFKKLLKGNL